MAKTPNKANKPLSDGEVEVLSALWEGGSLTAQEIWERLRQSGPVDRTTVATRVRTMLHKGQLVVVEDGRPVRYAAAVPKRAALEWSLQDLLRRFFGGAKRPALNTFISENTQLSERDKRALVAELAKFDRPDPTKVLRPRRP